MDNKLTQKYLENGSLALAIIFLGVMAGFFWTYSFNVNIAMLQVDGKTYATMQSLFNQNVRHFTFFLFFFGSGILISLATVLNLKQRKTISFWLILCAAITYVAGIIIFTKQINLPLNYYTESWDTSSLPDNWQAIRADWNSANDFRVISSFTSFILCVISLLVRTLKVDGTRKSHYQK